MPPRIILEVTNGPLAGRKYVFDERTTCIIGRMPGCNLCLPNDPEHQTVSRHHCILDINPPDIRIRDFGSRNGTFVNGEMIGRRATGMTPEEGQRLALPEVDLKEGDQVRLGTGTTKFFVYVRVPAYCADCAVEIPEDDLSPRDAAADMLCPSCRSRAAQEGRSAPIPLSWQVCAHCGCSVAGEASGARRGEYVCAACRGDLPGLAHELVQRAASGEGELQPLAGCTIVRELGRGSMGAVFLATHRASHEQVALKVMLPQVACDERAREMFLREMENTRALRHPNIVQLYGAGCSQGAFFCTQEYCESGSLDQLLESRGGVLAVETALAIIEQVLDGLEYAHHAEIPCARLADGQYGRGTCLVHSDLKPQNIFISGSGRACMAKVGDYGLARAFDTAGLSGLSRSGSSAGTPVFMPYQQMINFKHAKPDIDVWAATACLYAMLTGFTPRDFPSRVDPWQVVLSTPPVPIRQRNPHLPPRLAQVIDQALQDTRELHFTSAADLKRALLAAM